jgi:hypothetical protein
MMTSTSKQSTISLSTVPIARSMENRQAGSSLHYEKIKMGDDDMGREAGMGGEGEKET